MKKNLFICLILLLAVAMIGSLAACGPKGDAPAVTTDDGTDASDGTALNGDTSTTDPATDGETTAADEPTVEQYVYKHVVIVGVDGAGAFFKEAKTPNLDKIFADGAVTYEGITSTPSISAQSWGSLFHGVTPEFHGLDNGITSYRPYPADSEFPSFFRVIREQMPEASLASFCHWSNVNIGIIEDGIGVHKESADTDIKVIKMARDYVTQEVENGNGAPTMLFIHLDEADAAGHGSGYGTAVHLKKIKQQDVWIDQLYDTYDELGLLEDTLFIVTTDHGGLGNDHGGSSDAEMKIMFAAAGKTVEKGTIGEMGIRDTASIVLHALGLEQPKSWTGRVPSGLFKGVVAGERPVYEIDGSDREHVSVSTPEAGSAVHISQFITDKDLVTYLTFDGDVTDEMGAATTSGGKLYFVEGYFGESARLEDGYVSIPDYAPGTDSFSVSLWVNTRGVSSDPPLFSNKNWDNGYLSGFVFCIKSGSVQFNMGDGENRMDFSKQLPTNYATGWMHLTLVVDREAAVVKISTDFGAFQTLAIPEELKDVSLDAYGVLNIGQDGTGAYGVPLSAAVDEFMVFDGALTEGDLASLAEYYGK